MSDRPGFIDELAGQLADAEQRVERRRRRSRRIAAGTAAAALVLGAVAFVPALINDDTSNELVAAGPGDGAEPALSDGQATEGETWTVVPSSIGGEAEPGVFWTGTQVVVLRTENGGNDVTGERWDPATNETTQIAASGLSWRVGAAMVWTGNEVLVVGGSSGPALNQIGAAYDPASDSWRPIADPPGEIDGWTNTPIGPAVWTGSEMIVWRAGLAYDPVGDSWRTITPSPLSERARPAAAWTGTQLVVWGGCYRESEQCDETNRGLLADGAIYDPVADTWTAMPPSPLPGTVHMVAGWTGDEVLIVGTDPSATGPGPAAAFDPTTSTWRTIASSPLSARRGAAGVWAYGRFIIWGGGDGTSDAGSNDGAFYDPATDQWESLPVGPGPGRSLHTMTPVSDGVYISATRTKSPPLLLRDPTSPPTTTPTTGTATETAGPLQACTTAPTAPAGSGLVGLPVGETWPAGFRDGFSMSEHAYALIEDPTLEWPWYVIGTVVRDLGDRPLGIAVWIMPDPIVSFEGPGEPTDPIEDPESWHLYAVNNLAEQVSIWRPHDSSDLETNPEDIVRSCLGETPEPLPFINGTLLNGDAWILTDDPAHGLCLAQSGVDYGCDDVGPVVRPDDPAETIRIAGTLNPDPGISEDNAGDLAYGYLLAGAAEIELVLPDGSTYPTGHVLDIDARLWAAPIEPGNNPTLIRYLDGNGRQIGTASN